MAGTYTSRGNLYKTQADGDDNVDPVLDLNNNWDRVDALLGWRPVTSGTVPASAFQGAPFFRTDTGKAYINSGAGGSAALSLVQVMVAGASFDSGMSMTGDLLVTGEVRSTHATGAGRAFVARLTGDVDDRFRMDGDGPIAWGNGTDPTDAYIARTGVNTLETGSNFNVGGDITVGGGVSADSVVVDARLEVNGATVRPQLHTATTVANTTSETALQTVTIPANDAVTGATYRIRIGGTAAVTGTPTMTFRLKIGGTGGTSVVSFSAITARSGMSDGYWELEALLTCVTTGGAATWSGWMKMGHNFLTGVGTYTTHGPIAVSSVSRDSTVSQDMVVSVQWSAASSSNTITARSGISGREC